MEGVEIYEVSYSKKYHSHISCSFSYKVVYVDDRFSKSIVLFRDEKAAYEFIKAIRKEYEHCKKVMKKHFNKNLIITDEEKEKCQSSNTCWICKNLVNDDDEEARDHCHVTGKFRREAHWSCNINLQLTKKFLLIFHNLRDYDSHLIFSELSKFDVKVDVIPNGLEKYMASF